MSGRGMCKLDGGEREADGPRWPRIVSERSAQPAAASLRTAPVVVAVCRGRCRLRTGQLLRSRLVYNQTSIYDTLRSSRRLQVWNRARPSQLPHLRHSHSARPRQIACLSQLVDPPAQQCMSSNCELPHDEHCSVHPVRRALHRVACVAPHVPPTRAQVSLSRTHALCPRSPVIVPLSWGGPARLTTLELTTFAHRNHPSPRISTLSPIRVLVPPLTPTAFSLSHRPHSHCTSEFPRRSHSSLGLCPCSLRTSPLRRGLPSLPLSFLAHIRPGPPST